MIKAAWTVIDDLGRYSHRIALSDRRLLDFDEDDATVEVRDKDHRDENRRKVMSLSGEELIRRFLLHVLPKGFMQGATCRLPGEPLPGALSGADPHGPCRPGTGTGRRTGGHRTVAGYPCPTCRTGRLHVTQHLAPRRRGQGVMNAPAPA